MGRKMEGLMKAAVMTGIRKMEIQKVPIPKTRENEVLINVKHIGICGSDIHYYEFGNIGDYVIDSPFILGHEASGIIVEVGEKVTDLEVGDQVAIEPGVPCGTCDYCREGRYNLCPDIKFLATPPISGVFQEYIAFPAEMVYNLPNNMDTIEGAMLEPLNCGLYAAAHLSKIKIGQTALVLGCGCIGLLLINSLQAQGISDIYAVDVVSSRIKKAESLGVKAVWDSRSIDVVEKIKEVTGGKGADVVFETAGNKVTTQQSVHAVARGGKIVITGMVAEAEIPMDIVGLVCKEAEIHTQFRYKNLYPTAIKLVSEGKIDVKKVISHQCTLEEVPQIFEKCINNKAEVIKAVVAL